MAEKCEYLPADPRWITFCERYAGDLVRFAIEAVGLTISEQQKMFFAAVATGGSRVSISSGHGTGKTTALASIILWHMLCFYQSFTLITSNDVGQLKATVWKEIGIAIERIRRGPQGWIADYVEFLANGVCRIKGHEKTWFAESKTANEKNANKLAGRHARWLLIIADEASSLPESVLETLYGALTEKDNRMILTSQPTRVSGFFYDTHHKNDSRHGGAWKTFIFSSFESPFVSDSSLKEHWEAYDEDERRVRLLGEFPSNSSKLMMGRSDAEKMYERGRIIEDNEPWGWLVLSDVASGEGLRDKSVCLIARVIGYGDRGENPRRVEVVSIPVHSNAIRANLFAGSLSEHGSDYKNVTYVVDSGGLGINVCQNLEDMNKIVHRVNWGTPCFKKENRERYLNLRAQAMHHAARAAKEGRLSVLCDEWKRTLIDQSARIPKTFTENGRIRVPQKGGKEWDGMGSPDLWDAVCFAFLENASYVACGETDDESSDQINDVINAAIALFE